MNLPLQSITIASFGIVTVAPAATILPSLINNVASAIVVCGSFTIVAWVNAYKPSRGSAKPFTGNPFCALVANTSNAKRAVNNCFLMLSYIFKITI